MYVDHSTRLDELNTDHARCCSSFLCEAIGKDILVIFDDVT